METRREYLKEIQGEYLTANKQQKTQLLNEATKRTGLNRKYITRRLSAKVSHEPKQRKKRAAVYSGDVIAALVTVWEIFDCMCGQRLEPVLQKEVDNLRKNKELICSDNVAEKIKNMKSATIDRRLKHEKEVRHLSKNRSPSIHPLLYQKIPVKTSSEWDRNEVGNIQLDYVVHGGASVQGHFAHTLSAAEISVGWWEGAAIMGRSMKATHKGLKAIRSRLPFLILEIHPDNDTGMVNNLIYSYCEKESIAMSRSRPNKKNDNAWVEQRNWTHVRKVVGYLRYDTEEEVFIMNELYQIFGLYRNFFLPTMKLVEKIRMGGKVKRKYDTPQSPYQRLLTSDDIDEKTKKQLTHTYNSLNPAQVKRQTKDLQDKLYMLYEKKKKTVGEVQPFKKLNPRIVT